MQHPWVENVSATFHTNNCYALHILIGRYVSRYLLSTWKMESVGWVQILVKAVTFISMPTHPWENIKLMFYSVNISINIL